MTVDVWWTVTGSLGAGWAFGELRAGSTSAVRPGRKVLPPLARGGCSVAYLGVVQGGPVVGDPRFDVLDAPQLAHGHLVVGLREVGPTHELVDALTRHPEAVFDLTRTHQVATHKQDHRQDPTRHLYNGQSPDRNVHVPSLHLPMRSELHVKCETHRRYALTCEQYEQLLDMYGRQWRRCGGGWSIRNAHHESWGRFPVSWDRLIYAYGPINPKVEGQP